MRETVYRKSYPRAGDYLAFVRFLMDTPVSERDRVFVAAAKDAPGTFLYCVFPHRPHLTQEQADLLKVAEGVMKHAPAESPKAAKLVGAGQ